MILHGCPFTVLVPPHDGCCNINVAIEISKCIWKSQCLAPVLLKAKERVDELVEEMDSRVVITGIGVVTPIGNGVDAFWESLLAGRSGIGPITLFDASESPVKIGGEVKGLDFFQYMPSERARKMSRTSKLAVAAAKLAVQDSGLVIDEKNARDVDIFMGVACPDLATIAQTVERRIKHGPQAVNPYGPSAAATAAPAANVSVELQISGEVVTLSTGCSSSTNAIGYAMRKIQSGKSRVILAGGADAGIQMDLIACYANGKVLSTRNGDPQGASRPFEANRDGHVLSEAAGILVLEEYEHAKRRGAKVYAELIGYGTSSDCFSVTQVSEDPRRASMCLERMLADARLDAGHIGYYCAHGSSSRITDTRETQMLKMVFKKQAYKVPVSSIKSMMGHPFGAAGVLQTATCALAIRHGAIPPTINYEVPDPDCDLDYVPNQVRDEQVRAAVSYALGVGGNNAALALKHC